MDGYSISEQGDSFLYRCIITEDYLQKAVHGLRSRGQWAVTGFFVLLAAVGLLSLLQIIVLFNNFMSSMLILYALLFWCIQSQNEKKTVRRILERCCAHVPADVEREYTFGEEIISYSPITSSRHTFVYHEIKSFRSTKDSFLFLLNGVTFVSIPKACFAEGQEERFARFIYEKMNRPSL